MDTKQSNKRLVSVVDSHESHRQELCKALTSYYDIVDYDSARNAMLGLRRNIPALIIVGKTADMSSPMQFLMELKQDAVLCNVPVLQIIGGKDDSLLEQSKEFGGSEVLLKPYRRTELIGKISQILNSSVEAEWEALPETQRSALRNSVDVFNNIADVLMTGEAVEFTSVKNNCQSLVQAVGNNDFRSILDGVRNHDDYTYAHSMRVATMLTMLGHAAGFRNDDQLMLSSGGLLHDVGKMKIPHHILNKPGRLDDDEFELMKTHVTETVDYLKLCGDIPKSVFIIAEQHHEKIDGTGYPYGLKGAELNELARMAAIVDVFSALTDRRVYKPPMDPHKAMQIMTEEMTSHLDPHYVSLFKTILYDMDLMD